MRSVYPCILLYSPMGRSLLPPLDSASEIHELYMYICQNCIVERENGKSLLKRWHPFTFPNFAQITDKCNFLCFVF